MLLGLGVRLSSNDVQAGGANPRRGYSAPKAASIKESSCFSDPGDNRKDIGFYPKIRLHQLFLQVFDSAICVVMRVWAVSRQPMQNTSLVEASTSHTQISNLHP